MSHPFFRTKCRASTPCTTAADIESPHISPDSPRSKTQPESRRGNSRTVIVVLSSILLVVGVTFYALSSNDTSASLDSVPLEPNLQTDYFSTFEGRHLCALSSLSLYTPARNPTHSAYCPTRSRLLRALSSGGRHGFDAPFHPQGCHYRWYSTQEICLILARFDAVVFVGDAGVQDVYAGLNVLLRRDLAFGAMRAWDMGGEEREKCRCEAGFRGECRGWIVERSEDVVKAAGGGGYACGRTPHLHLPIMGPLSPAQQTTLTTLLAKFPSSARPIPLIHSLSLSLSPPLSAVHATSSIDQLLGLTNDAVQSTFRNYPYLFLGPTAAGHLKPQAKVVTEGNNAVWRYSEEMRRVVAERGGEWLGLYNATVQAGSWDGSERGLGWGVTGAMMVMNWLARVETS